MRNGIPNITIGVGKMINEDKYKPYDKAGSYGIQDGFSVYVEKINGCFYNVMGFPISRFHKFYKAIVKGDLLID